ncbi:MAG: hypothetical protein Q9219_006842 [cf. Caloplaca sp. 3 TL-2023]
MLAQSSPISYPLSSSPPLQVAGRKRLAQPDTSSEPKKRLIRHDFPLSLRDPHHRAESNPWKTSRIPEISPPTQPKSKSHGPFVDEDDFDNVPQHESLGTYTQSQEDYDYLTEALQPTLPFHDLSMPDRQMQATAASGRRFRLKEKSTGVRLSYEQLIAERSSTEAGKATKSFYGIEIHKLLEKTTEIPTTVTQGLPVKDVAQPSVESPILSRNGKKGRTLMWTEKYRAKKFTDLVGDEGTHRDVLRWIKRWDPLVFSSSSKRMPKTKTFGDETQEQPPCKILLLTGPPGLGKTTLAHVCARQAGYEVVEINASDERSRDVVKGKIRDLVGTENVRGVKTKTADGTVRKAGRPVCVVVDEVDGVVGGTGGGGEGGFIKALIDLVALDKKNTEMQDKGTGNMSSKRKRKGDRFRLLRPMVLICNDVYHPALRPLRSSGIADVVHVRKPPMDKVVNRLKEVFASEGIPCDADGVRRLCEAAWGVSNRMEGRSSLPGIGEGDIRGLLVVGEWVAAKFRAHDSTGVTKPIRLTKQWLQQHVLEDLTMNGNATRNLGRGSAKEAVDRIFQHNAGFPKEPTSIPSIEKPPARTSGSFGVSEAGKRYAMDRLRDLVESSGECDRIITDCFTAYPSQPFQDDTLLSKPSAACEWLHFHDSLSARVFSGQEWELNPYLSQSALGFHELFASMPRRMWAAEQSRMEHEDDQGPTPFLGPRADYEASGTLKENKAVLEAFQSCLATPLSRYFRSDETAVVDLLPYLVRILNPSVKPVIVGGSGDQKGIVSVRRREERTMLERAVSVMNDVGIAFERSRVEMTHGGGSNYVYRMEPPIDTLVNFETAATDGVAASSTRYAIRQALDQESQKLVVSQRRKRSASSSNHEAVNGSKSSRKDGVSAQEKGTASEVKRDFFGRIVQERPAGTDETEKTGQERCSTHPDKESEWKVFVSFHEGYSNAVRKPITLHDLMRGL